MVVVLNNTMTTDLYFINIIFIKKKKFKFIVGVILV